MIWEKIKNFIKNLKPEWLIFGLSLIWGSFFAWYVYKLGITTVFVDQNSHLNLTREVFDSMTPGISQIGFWPPLLHLLMIPFTAIDFLYRTGLAGAFTLIPFLGLAAAFFYKLLFVFIKNKFISFSGAILFLLNPHILYYAVTPMMEILFISLLFGTAYFLIQWLNTDKTKYLIFLSIFISLASVARFEGLTLVPLVGLIVLAQLIRKKIPYKKIEASVILFSFIAILGFLSLVVYGWIFGSNPLAFLNSDWSAQNQQKDYFLPAARNILKSTQYLMHASYYMLGKTQVIIALVGFLIILIFYRTFKFIAVSLVLFSPFIFDWLALYRGNAIIYVADLPPYNQFFNERYGIYWVGFVIFTILVLISKLDCRLLKIFKNNFCFFNTIIPSILLMVVFLFLNILFLYKTTYVQNFIIVRQSAQGYPTKDQTELAKKLQENYDTGKILITRALHDFVTVNAGIPLKNYIHESNYIFYDQSLNRPWLFAKWVIMYNTNTGSALDWAKKNEKVSARWGNSQTFLNYYNLVFENNRERLYKINEKALRQYAIDKNLKLSEIPSLNSNITWWNPETIYEKMGAKDLEKIAEANVKIEEKTGKNEPEKNKLEVMPESALMQYTVKAGDNLWDISEKQYGFAVKWKEIAQKNNLKNPDLIYPGNILNISK